MKRTLRIELVRYTRLVTLNSEGGWPGRAECPAIDVLLDALGDSVPAPEELRHEIHADAVALLAEIPETDKNERGRR